MSGRIDLSKLADLRERHARLQEGYRGTAERARRMLQEIGRLVAETVSEADNESGHAILQGDAEKLAAMPASECVAARLDPRAVQRVVAARRAADKQQRTAEALGVELRASVILMERINEYATRIDLAL